MRPTPYRLVALSLLAVSLSVAGAAIAQGPQQQEEPKNLKVLPKDTPRREVIRIMNEWEHATGMECDECHARSKDPGARSLDFASDEKPEKETARKMFKMMNSINDQLAGMGFKQAPRVQCVTCHHGVPHPATLADELLRASAKGGTDAAVAQYRKLRAEHYGSAAYDFSAEGLKDAANQFLQKRQDADAAIAMLKLNLESFGEDVGTWVMLSRAQQQKGDRAAAIASLEKAVSLAPNSQRLKGDLERLKNGQ
jgi:tetratricopeptide (TPR) repeat protein